jgi:hypothetical protein
MRANHFKSYGKGVVGTTGFEPAAPASRTRCSTRLSHVPTGRNHTLFFFVKQAYFIADNGHKIIHHIGGSLPRSDPHHVDRPAFH